jgi:hypothetical protein
MTGSKKFVLPTVAHSIRPRPLWSSLSNDAKRKLRDQLRSAYDILSQRNDLGGTIGQAWIHSYYCTHPVNITNVHCTSAFLPWHRAFLYFHERLLQGALRDDNFRLPVWDWEANSDIPEMYNGWVTLPGANCDYSRNKSLTTPIHPSNVRSWLLSNSFLEFAGGPYAAVRRASGGLHDDVHIGTGGFMPVLGVAALDPVFYGHHANVDRCWSAWWDHYQDQEGFTPLWPQDEWFFFDVDQVVRVTLNQFLDTRRLGYWNEPLHIPPFYEFATTQVQQQDDGTLHPSDTTDLFKLFSELELRGADLSQPPPVPNVVLPAYLELENPGVQTGISYSFLIAGQNKHGLPVSVPLGAFGTSGHNHDETLLAMGNVNTVSLDLLLTGHCQLKYADQALKSPVVRRFEIRFPDPNIYTSAQIKRFLS